MSIVIIFHKTKIMYDNHKMLAILKTFFQIFHQFIVNMKNNQISL